MAVVVDPVQERREQRRYRQRLIASLTGLCLSAIALVALVTAAWTNHGQQVQIAKFSDSSECRSQVASEESAAHDRATVLLLNSIVMLAERQPLDLDQVSKTAAALDSAAKARLASVEACK